MTRNNDWVLAQKAVKDNDESAYRALIDRYQGPIHALVFRSAGNNETARDITQEVFVKAWFGLRKVKPRAMFSTWLFKIAINLCRDHAKSKAYHNASITDSLFGETGEMASHPHHALPPDMQAQAKETMELVQSAISSLPNEFREAFVLGAVEQRPYKEVGEILGISAKAVELRIYRAKKALAEQLHLQS